MKILDGYKTMRGRPAQIPDCNRYDLPLFFKEMGYQVGVEVGVEFGIYSEALAKEGFKMYGVDPYLVYDDYEYGNKEQFQKRLDDKYTEALERLKPYDYTLIRKTSADACKDFEDESLDFVYVDANHDFKYVVEDIFLWSKKIRKGGAVAGHDYAFNRSMTCHVKWVLPAYTKAYKINNWYVIGRSERLEGEKRDQFRSWFWIK